MAALWATHTNIHSDTHVQHSSIILHAFTLLHSRQKSEGITVWDMFMCKYCIQAFTGTPHVAGLNSLAIASFLLLSARMATLSFLATLAASPVRPDEEEHTHVHTYVTTLHSHSPLFCTCMPFSNSACANVRTYMHITNIRKSDYTVNIIAKCNTHAPYACTYIGKPAYKQHTTRKH